MAGEAIHAAFGIDVEGALQSLNRLEHRVAEATAHMAKHGFRELLAPIAEVTAGLYTIHGAIEGFKGGLDLGSDLQNMANRTGASVENLYELRTQFKDAKLDVNSLTNDLAKMSSFLEKSVMTGEGAPMLQSMGLDPQKLVTQDPGTSFRQIGDAIAALQNPYDRATAAATIFHDKAAELLQVFMSPSWKEGGGGAAAKMLDENAAAFSAASTILGHTGEKIESIFAGIESNIVPALLPLLEAFDHMDFTSVGQQIGEVVGTFMEAFSEGKLGEVLSLSFQVAIGNAINFMAAGITAYFQTFPVMLEEAAKVFVDLMGFVTQKEFWQGLGDSLLSFVNQFNALLMQGIAALLGTLRNVPGVGGTAGRLADGAQSMADRYTVAAVSQGKQGEDHLQNAFSGRVTKALDQWGVGMARVSEQFGQNLSKQGSLLDLSEPQKKLNETILGLQENLDAKNQSGRELGREKAARDQSRDQSALNGLAMQGAGIADSMRKIGGGGVAYGPSAADPLLTEAQRQTGYLGQIAAHTAANPSSAFNSPGNPLLTEAQKQTALQGEIKSLLSGISSALSSNLSGGMVFAN